MLVLGVISGTIGSLGRLGSHLAGIRQPWGLGNRGAMGTATMSRSFNGRAIYRIGEGRKKVVYNIPDLIQRGQKA